MPSIQTSLLTAVPAGVGHTLFGLCMAGVRRYIVTSPPENAVNAAPARRFGTTGVSNGAETDLRDGQGLQERRRRDLREERVCSGGEPVQRLGPIFISMPLLQPRVQDVGPGGQTRRDVSQMDPPGPHR